MRRKDREVADLEGQLAILEQCPVCRVAINDPASGVPYLVPLNFGMAAGPQSLTLYFHCAPVGTKLDLLRADPNVSFEADCPGTVSGGATSCTYGMNYQSVIGRGTVRFVEGGEKLTALQALMQHYHCPDLPFDLGKQVLETSFLISLAFLRFIGHPVLHRLFQIQGEATLSDQPVWFGRLGRSAFPFFTLLSFTLLFFTFL